MPRLVRICLKRVLIDAIIVSVYVVFFVILRDLRVSEKNHPKTSSAPSPMRTAYKNIQNGMKANSNLD